jgi:hypothetical protein
LANGAGVIVVLFLTRLAAAHTPGLSQASFDVVTGGRVEGRFTFASAEPLGGVALDRGHDGVVTAEDVQAASPDLARFLLDGVDVTADGTRCPATFREASLQEADGLVLEATYACPEDAARIEATLYYLSRLPRTHREIARITAGAATEETLLSADKRAIAIDLPVDPGRARRRRTGRTLVFAAALFATTMLALFAWRWRAAKKRA